MNIIEAWKQAKEGQKISLSKSGITVQKGKYLSFRSEIDKISEESILSDDWEMVREKKKVVIENVTWHISQTGAIYPKDRNRKTDWLAFTERPPMTMTLEWEE